ncbi:MAG TPA: glycosyltransferase family 1 protein [Pirellulales bacterium]
MKIGIDMLGDQSAGRTRGVGRYTRGLVSRLIADTRREFVLYYHRGLPRSASGFWQAKTVGTSSTSVGNALRGVPRSACDVAPPLDGTARSPFPTEVALPTNGIPSSFPTQMRSCETRLIGTPGDSLHLAIEQLAQANPDRLDLLLLTCPLENFQGYLPPFPAGGRVKLAAIVYDLVPLIFPADYLHHPAIAQAYRRALCALRQYDALLTISEASRRDMLERLELREDRVFNISAGSDEERFTPAANDAEHRADAARLSDLAVREPFLYSQTALDARKNLPGLLAAAECLPPELRERHQIVLSCGAGGPDDFEKVRSVIARSRVAGQVLLLESIDDATLRALYRRAAAFVFPSRYEGFGLPLLEAMQCGAAVLAGNNSSQVEVVGDAGLVADVDRPAELAACIARMLTDKSLAKRLRERALRQARRFSWAATAQRCEAALTAAMAAPPAAHWLGVWGARARLAMSERVMRVSPFASRPDVRPQRAERIK